MAGRFTIEAIFKGVDNMSKIIAQIEGRAGRFSRGLKADFAGVGKGFERMTGGLAQIASYAATAGVALGGLAAAGLYQVMVATNAVADQTARIESVLPHMAGTVVQSSEEMKDAALAWSKVHKTTAEEFLKSSYMMISAGLNEEQALAGSRTASLVAAATFGDAGAAAEALATQYNVLGDKSKDVNVEMGRLGDVMTRTQQLFQFKDLAQVTDGLKYATPIAKMFGQNLETLNTVMGMLNNSGIVGTQAGTAYTAMMEKMIPASKALGFAIAHAKDGTLDFGGTLANIHAKFGDFDKASDATKAKLEEAFGRRGITGIALLSDKADEFSKNLAAISDNAGAAASAAAIIESKGSGPLDILNNKFTAAKVAMGDALTPVTGPFVERIGKVIDSVTAWVNANQGLIAGGIQDAIATATPIVKAFGDGFMEMLPVIKEFAGFLFTDFGSGAEWLVVIKRAAEILGGVTAAAIGVAAVFAGVLAAGFADVVTACDWLIGAWNSVINAIGRALFAFSDFFANVSAWWRGTDFGALAKGLIDGLVNGITGGVGRVVSAVKNLGAEALAALKGAWDSHSPSVKFAMEGDNAAQGVAGGVTAGIPHVVKATRNMGAEALAALTLKAPAVDTSALTGPAPFHATAEQTAESWSNLPALKAAINSLSLGSDAAPSLPMSASPAPQLAQRPADRYFAERSGDNQAQKPGDGGVITVRAEPGSSADVTKQPKDGPKLVLAPSGTF